MGERYHEERRPSLFRSFLREPYQCHGLFLLYPSSSSNTPVRCRHLNVGCPVLFHMKFWNSSWLPMFEYRERPRTLGEMKRNGLKHHEDGAAGKNESLCSGEREEFSSELELETYITTYYNCVRFSNSTTFAWSRSRSFHCPYISRTKLEQLKVFVFWRVS